jgi:hypothetical protein
MRRLRTFPLEDLLLAQVVPGFLLAVAWTVMYEIYHEDGSYYTTLMQEILGSEDLLPYFLLAAVLMAFPAGIVVDTARHVLGEVWLGLPRLRRGWRAPPSPLHWIENLATLPEDFDKRYVLYRHAWVTLLTPARTAGNLALILLVLTVWFVVKIVRMRGWLVFSLAFIIGTPLVGVGLVLALLARYAAGVGEFHRLVQESIFPPKGTPVLLPDEAVPPSPS